MPSLPADDRSILLRLARASIEDALLGVGSVDRILAERAPSAALEERRGAFVTLHESRATDAGTGSNRLRGCIGTLEAQESLWRSVVRNARHAALDDPRFAPVTADELPGLSLEISALTPLRRVRGPEEIVPGRHGVCLEHGTHRAVFLPQVATEQGWGTEQMLEHLARKAGLPADAWRTSTFSVFEAEVFGE